MDYWQRAYDQRRRALRARNSAGREPAHHPEDHHAHRFRLGKQDCAPHRSGLGCLPERKDEALRRLRRVLRPDETQCGHQLLWRPELGRMLVCVDGKQSGKRHSRVQRRRPLLHRHGHQSRCELGWWSGPSVLGPLFPRRPERPRQPNDLLHLQRYGRRNSAGSQALRAARLQLWRGLPDQPDRGF